MEKLGDLIKSQRTSKKLNQTELGQLVGYGQTTVSDWEKGIITQIRNPDRVADVLDIEREKFLDLMAIAIAETEETKRISPKLRTHMARSTKKAFDSTVLPPQPHVIARQGMIGGTRDVPVYGRAQGGDDGVFEFNGEIMGWEVRLPDLEGIREAYAVYVDGVSMAPRYKAGETVWINPNMPAKREDDVIIQLHSGPEGEGAPLGFIKEFVGWRGNFLVVKQHNPAIELRYPREQVKSVHKIIYSQRS